MERETHLIRNILVILLVAIVAGLVLNREWLLDYYRGMTYQPSSEMKRIRDDLQLTERGEFLFNAAQPELDESEEFNEHCVSGSTEVAVLGCYAAQRIFIYNIVDDQLKGIRELTAAHELLHVVFARMSSEEREALRPDLEKVYADNKAVLEEDLSTYTSAAQYEELYVRAGTEVAKLPEALEKHYGEFFKDQDAIVAYYDSYNAVFRALKAELDTLTAEMEAINAEITQKSKDLEQANSQLNAKIEAFNSCARTPGCFATEMEFYSQRAELMVEQDTLMALYDEINNLVNAYNAKVEVYNADVLKGKKLNTLINSNSKPEEIE